MEYQQLSRGLGEIRLLSLIRDEAPDGAENVPLRCSLEHVGLASVTDFVALSYLWGDSEDTVPLLVDDNQVAITRNLANALDYLQRIGITRVWADAICINQQDEHERAAQIQRMGAIYRAASITYTWLPTGAHNHSAETHSSLDILQYASFGDIHNLRRTMHSLAPFFNDPYWHRVWILQEVALSKCVKLIYGSYILPLVNLEVLMRLPSEAENRVLSIQIHGFQHVRNVVDLCSQIRLKRPIQLVEALTISSRSESTEIRDRVYGLWGLAFDAMNYLPEPSYTQSLQQLCLTMTRAHIDSTGSLDIIPTLALEHVDPGVPSWSVDWFQQETWLQSTGPQLLPCSIPGISHKWKAKQDAVVDLSSTSAAVRPWPYPLPWSAHNFVPADCSYNATGTVLTIKGRILGTVHNCTSTLDGSPGPPSLEASLFVEWTRPKIWRALFYLFNFEHATRWNSLNTEDDSLNRAIMLSREDRVQTPQYMLFLHDVFLMDTHRTAASHWITRNASFSVFGVSLSSAVQVSVLGWTLIFANFAHRLLIAGAPVIILIACFYILGYNMWQAIVSALIVGFLLLITAGWFMVEPITVMVLLKGYGNLWKSKEDRMVKILELNMRLATGTFGVGWVHARAVPGDSVAILTGCSVPLVLRPDGDEGWVVIGGAIVYEAMDGEMMDQAACEYIEIH